MQKTAYEMRISDWSSDVCSSDLDHLAFGKGDLFERSAVFLARLARLRIDPPALINRNLQLQPDIAGGSLVAVARAGPGRERSEEHTSELQSLMRISYAVFCLKKKK